MTILFEEDWKKYPLAIADINTKNVSFVRYAKLLKSMGVSNHLFPLALYDSSLVGLDPWSENLTKTEKLKIIAETENNYWYYLREVARFPAQSGSPPFPVNANRSIVGLSWTFLNGITFLLIQLRQTGKSKGVDQLKKWLLQHRCRDMKIAYVTKDAKHKKESMFDLRTIIELTPEYMKMYSEKKDVGNEEIITVKGYGNRLIGHIGNSSDVLAEVVGRGLSVEMFHGDEVNWIKNIGTIVSAAAPALSEASRIAKLNNQPSGIIYTTTAGRDGQENRDDYYVYSKLYNEGAVFKESFYDAKNNEELIKIVRKLSPTGMKKITMEFNHIQLGKTNEWVLNTIEEMATDNKQKILRDLFNVWCGSEGVSPFSQEDLLRINGSTMQPIEENRTIDHGYEIRWYVEDSVKYMKNNKTILSLDPSEALGGDDIGLIISSVETGETIAGGNINKTNITKFCGWLLELIISYVNMVALIERKSTGPGILDDLSYRLTFHGINPFKRLVNDIVSYPTEHKNQYKEIMDTPPNSGRMEELVVKYKNKFGYGTTGGVGRNSRNLLYGEVLTSGINIGSEGIRDIMLIRQLSGLSVVDNRLDHRTGGKDDMVISWLLCWYFLTKVKNMDGYDIDVNSVLTGVNVKQKNKKEVTNVEKLRRNNVKTIIANLEHDINLVRNAESLAMLEKKWNGLKNTISEDDVSIDIMSRIYNTLEDKRKRLVQHDCVNIYH